MKQEPAEATMRSCHISAVGILAIDGEEEVNRLLDFRTYFNKHRTHTSPKGERRIRLGHGQSPIPIRFDGNHTVGPSIRHRWVPDAQRFAVAAVFGRPLQKP
jgi:hypothetical protein